MKIGDLIIRRVPADKGLSGLAYEFEEFVKHLRKKYKLDRIDEATLRTICYEFRKIRRLE